MVTNWPIRGLEAPVSGPVETWPKGGPSLALNVARL